MRDTHEATPSATVQQQLALLAGNKPKSKTQNISVFFAEELAKNLPTVCAAYENYAAAEPMKWYSWADDSGWTEMPYATLAKAMQLIVASKHKGQLRGAVSDALTTFARHCCDSSLISDWDKPGDLLLLADGISAIELSSGKIRRITPDIKLSKKCPVSPGSYAQAVDEWDAGVWKKILSDWFGDEETIITVLKLCGQGLKGNPAQKFGFLYGPGGTGKSSFLFALSNALGENMETMSVAYVASAGGYTPHLTGLQVLENSRIVECGEIPSKGARWNEELVKNISGGDKIPVRGMRQDFRTIESRTLLLVYGNHRPNLRDTGNSMRRRLVLIPFRHKAASGIDFDTMTALLKYCAPQILASLVFGLHAYQAEGMGLSEEVARESREYLEEENMFLAELRLSAEPDPDAVTPLAELYKKFRWRQQCDEGPYYRMTNKGFAKNLREQEIEVRKGSRNVTVVEGWKVME